MSTNARPSSGPGLSGRDRALTVLGAVISIAALAAIVAWALQQDAPVLPNSAERLGELAGAVGFYLGGCAVRAERWYELLRYNGAHPRRHDAYGLLAVANFGNNVLPARAGDALRVVLLAPRAQTDSRTVIGTIVAERVLDVVVLVGLFVVLAYGVLGGIDVPAGSRLTSTALIIAGVTAVIGVLAFVLHRRGHLRPVLTFLAPMTEATRHLGGRRHGTELVAWTLLVWGLEWTAWWLTAQAAGLDLGMLEVGYLMGLAATFALIPSGPGYVGTFDAAVVFGVRALGRTGAQALTYLLLLRFVVTAPITLIGLVVLIAGYGGIGRVRAVARA
jgi:glycosyltransferase 2 family protein